MKKVKIQLMLGIAFTALFCVFTATVKTVDVKAIGPAGTAVGFARLNEFAFDLFGENLVFYYITDWLGVAAVAIAFGFAAFGLYLAIKKKSVFKADKDILLLGAYYVVIVAVYVLFEKAVINYRPVLINGFLEASYPSSHTMITVCICSSAVMQFKARVKNEKLKFAAVFAVSMLAVFTVAGRLISGVHWFTDIVGGLFISTGLTALYGAGAGYINLRKTADSKSDGEN